MEHLSDLGLGVLALVSAASLLVAADRLFGRSDDDGPSDMGLD